MPAVPSVQLFNLLDSNVPGVVYNNNKKLSPSPSVAPFEGSFYDLAIMIPIQTTSEGVTAKNLPTLSTNGYMLVLSDIVDQNDYAKDQSELGIIDMVSKSSLSNQDFISDRQVLTHVISNPKTINYINVNILNPDLTDITLEPNSTILLKLTFPRPKNTILIQNTEDSIADNIITQQTEQQFFSEMKQAGVKLPPGTSSGGGDQPPQPPSQGRVERTAQQPKASPKKKKEDDDDEGDEGGGGRADEGGEAVEEGGGPGRPVQAGQSARPRTGAELRGGLRFQERRFESVRPEPRESDQFKREQFRVAELLDKGKITRAEAKVRLEQIRRRHHASTATTLIETYRCKCLRCA